MELQNAAPDGPAAFMFTEIVSRPLRWADDDWAHANELTLHKTCMYADQDAYADVLADMVSGYMLFPKSWYCLDQVWPPSPPCTPVCDKVAPIAAWSTPNSGHQISSNCQESRCCPALGLKTSYHSLIDPIV